MQGLRLLVLGFGRARVGLVVKHERFISLLQGGLQLSPSIAELVKRSPELSGQQGKVDPPGPALSLPSGVLVTAEATL